MSFTEPTSGLRLSTPFVILSIAGIIKVAIIDDGVDLEDLNTEYLAGGWYPVKNWPERRHMNTWYISETQHGTQMAKLVHQVCPYASLYVAKLDIRKVVYTSVAASAAVAIREAIKNDVNVISISWIIYNTQTGDEDEGIKDLKKAIHEASKANIIMFCAAEDIGCTNSGRPYPATGCNTQIIKRIGSAGNYVEKSQFVDRTKIDYLFPGVIHEGLTAQVKCEGSSIATAMASGFAALVLWCTALHNLDSTTDPSLSEITHGKEKTKSHSAQKEVDSMNSKTDGKSHPRSRPTDINFQRYDRVYGLFDKLKASDQNPFVDITEIMFTAAKHIDPAAKFVEKCKARANEFF